jgi:signal transduction histidine kinase
MTAVSEPLVGPTVKMRGLTIVRVICGVLLFACIGLTVALVLVATSAANNHASQARQIVALRSQVQHAQRSADAAMARANNVGSQGITKLQDDFTTLKGNLSTLQGTQRSLAREVTSLTNCMPEVQDEITGMQLDGLGTNSPYVDTSTTVSRVCQKVVYPPTPGTGG